MVRVNEIRQNIADEVKGIKNKIILSKILEIASLFRRAYSDKEYRTLTDAEWSKIEIINDVISCDNSKLKELRHVQAFTRTMLDEQYRKAMKERRERA